MRIIHMLSGTRHRIEIRFASPPTQGVGDHPPRVGDTPAGGRVGAWAQVTQPCVLALNSFERVVMVTEWSKNAAFPTPSRAYIVREYEMPPGHGEGP